MSMQRCGCIHATCDSTTYQCPLNSCRGGTNSGQKQPRVLISGHTGGETISSKTLAITPYGTPKNPTCEVLLDVSGNRHGRKTPRMEPSQETRPKLEKLYFVILTIDKHCSLLRAD